MIAIATRADFRQAMEQAGLVPPAEIIADGKLHRFASNGERDDDAGWYVMFADGLPAGVFGCWRAGTKQNWCAKSSAQMTPAERDRYQNQLGAIRRQRHHDERLRQAEAAQRAQAIWNQSRPASADHHYLKRKGIRPYGLQINGDDLVLPMLINGEISSLQFIAPDGGKKFLQGGAVKGGSYTIGALTEVSTILICEGFATGASLHEATGFPVVCALSAGNLPPVAEQVRQQYPTTTIVICGDNDPNGTGQRAARKAADAMGGLLAICISPPEFSTQGYKSDFNDIHTICGLRAVRNILEIALEQGATTMATKTAAAAVQSSQPETTSASDTITEATATALPQPAWPVLDPAAYTGVIGQFVKAVEPYSEADPVGMLLHSLQGFGCLVGLGPHVLVEHLPHHARLNVLLVGNSANARKGTSWSTPKLMLSKIDTTFTSSRVQSGLSSGEGLIYNVRDAAGDDPGEPDKRLLIIEQEFAGALKAMQREGNTLSSRIRVAWESGTFTPLTKRDRLIATNAHICIMGHITVTELLRLFPVTEQVNGFANRFLIGLVKRSKFLPSGQGAPLKLLEGYLSPISRIAACAQTRGEFKRDKEAEALWSTMYPKLEQEIPGLSGSILARGAAQVLRLSLLYCLSDLQEAERLEAKIRVPHLMAALAVWDYCKSSVLHIFGDAIGDPVADRLLRLLKTGPQTGNDLYGVMGKHAGDRDRKLQALELLSKLNLVHSITKPTAGRPIEEWHYGSAHTCQICALRVKSLPPDPLNTLNAHNAQVSMKETPT